MSSLYLNISHEKPSIVAEPRLRVVPHFSSGIVERGKREHAWKSSHARKGDTRRERFIFWVSAFSLFSRYIALSTVWRVCTMRLIKWISQFWMILVNPKHWICLNGTWDTQTEFITSQGTLDAWDFSSAVSGFCQVFIVTLAKNFFSRLRRRGFGLRPKMCWPSANTENSRRTREKPLVPRVKSRRPTPLNLMNLVSLSNTIIVKLNQEHPHRFYKRIHYFKTESVGIALLGSNLNLHSWKHNEQWSFG